ncbi:SusD/RagB family nutrient-binding outer membrane lipoprotein [Catalinimonas alkaloidigena]|nr:SusD/RagB family nutrient-binding outer membrane lipoprotein [Catalinimonas alkaloidigena]
MKIALRNSLLAGLLLSAACTGEFDEMNTNPNGPEEVGPEVILPYALEKTVDRAWGHRTRNERVNIDLAMCWVQYWARNIYTNEGDNYNVQPSVNSATWNGFYSESLINFKRIMLLTAPGADYENATYEGMSMVMTAWTYSLLTDIFGPIPYSDALKGTSDDPSFSPAYDDMETVYRGIIAMLDEANAKLMEGGPEASAGDIMFGGDVLRWKKFGNSLRLKLMNRVVHKIPEYKAEMQKMLDDPTTYPMFTSNDDYAYLQHTSSLPSNNEWHQVMRQDNRSDWSMSETLVDKLKALDDPRLEVYANANPEGAYMGMPNGLPDAVATNYLGTASTIGDYFLRPEAPSIIMSYSELLFVLAEAALDGDISGKTAEEYFTMAVEASFEQYGLEMPAGYLEGMTADKATIMTQKWIALYGEGIEAWTEYRRTGYPVMPPDDPQSAFQNDGDVPTRIVYPTSEQSLNNANLQQGISMLGTDNMHTELWWVEN